MSEYRPKQIEAKWQEAWAKENLYKAPETTTPENKMFILPQLPYPSGSGLHVGHAEVYTACDIFARYQRMIGKDVLQAIGWDSFGLPAENYAIKTNVHPRISTDKAIENFRSQIKLLGISMDWEREVGSHNPDYYKWTQWFFLLMYKRGLAYRKHQAVNWCEHDKTVLANDQVRDGKCERCDTEIVQRHMEQWYLKITDYADRLIDDLDTVDWPQETITRQRNWIGKSVGAEINFTVSGSAEPLTVFTTRPDTIFGTTYMVLAPEHALVQSLAEKIENWDEVTAYIDTTKKKTDLDRQIDQEKTGVALKGIHAINPVTREEIPVWIADYVLASYGSGAIMAVPAHDERDFAFAKKFGLEMKEVVAEKTGERKPDGVQRDGVAAVIEREDGKILALYNTQYNKWRLPAGGIEEGEALLETLMREIEEETGYTDVEIGRSLGTVEANYNANRKGVYRHRYLHAFKAKLKSETKGTQRLEDGEIFTMHWFTYDEALKKFAENPESLGEDIMIARAKEEAQPVITKEGSIINSEFLNGLEIPEATEAIIKHLEENGIGSKKTQYKLRDWSISRQRFWGAPIPMLKNQEEAEKKRSYVLLHGFTGSKESNFFPWLKSELETAGHSVWLETLPDSDAPNAKAQADFVLQSAPFDEDTVVVCHSHGGPTAYRLLEQLKTKVAKVVFVDVFTKPEFTDKERPLVAASDDYAFDFESIKSKAKEFVVIHDSLERTIAKKQAEELAALLDARLVYDPGATAERHFMSTKEPIVLEEAWVRGLQPVPEADLPVILPEDVDFKPTGESPLNYSPSFQDGVEEKYGKGWKREVDTLDTFMDSSWYFFRYLDPKNEEAFASPDQLKNWMPVDFYLGGEEHVNGHLLYSRFFTKVLFDAGYINFEEPFKKNRHQGLISGEDGRKMSKRWGNVINPTDVVNEYGADTIRMYEMFMGPLEQQKAWSTGGVKGVRKFLERTWRLFEKIDEGDMNPDQESLVHKTLKKVTSDTANLQFNTAIAKMMELTNELTKAERIAKSLFEIYVKMLAPYAPHMAEELWEMLGNKPFVSVAPWPSYDESKIVEETITVVAQVNGKVRAKVMLPADASEEDAKAAALAEANVQKWLDGKEPKKIIYVPGKLVSIVV